VTIPSEKYEDEPTHKEKSLKYVNFLCIEKDDPSLIPSNTT